MEYKGYLIKPLGTFPMYFISYKGSGALPARLKGNYTDHREAKLAIDGYLEGLKKGTRSGKAKGESKG